jgi:uncharacterized membrane protein YhaH (DUF805 family)
MYRLSKGRINRATYWVFLAILVAGVTAFVLLTKLPAPYTMFVLVALCTPRLHDFGRSGWWAGGVLIAYIILELASTSELRGLFLILMMLGLILLGIWRGRPGPNKYGPEPAPGVSFELLREEPKPPGPTSPGPIPPPTVS